MLPGLCRGGCKGDSGALPPAGTPQRLAGTLCASVWKKILPLRPQPATRWVSAAHHLLLPAVREAEARERHTGDPEAAGYSPSRRAPGACLWVGRLGKWYPAGPAASGGDAGLGCGPSTPRTRTAFALVISRGGRGSAERCSAAPCPAARTCRRSIPAVGAWRRRVSRQGAPASVTCR